MPTSTRRSGAGPAGPWTTVGKLTEDGDIEEQLFVLGSDSTLARDEFLRLLYGAQVSLEVGVGATLLSLFLGTLLGAIAVAVRATRKDRVPNV